MPGVTRRKILDDIAKKYAGLEDPGIRDFLIAHYKVTEREDTPFWRYCKNMDIPDSLANRLEIFRTRGEAMVVHHELFKEQSWFAVLAGQGLMPVDYHPVADLLSEDELKLRLQCAGCAFGVGGYWRQFLDWDNV